MRTSGLATEQNPVRWASKFPVRWAGEYSVTICHCQYP
jgi:hypothetical protein